jgi:hyperosmotically inducible periplasmic protein
MDRSFRPSSPAYATGPLAFLLGLGFGAALMYFLDPDNGRRRRALVREKSAHYAREARDRQAGLLRHAGNRARGAVASVRHRLHPDERVEDGVLLERVRAALGHVVGDPHALEIRVKGGIVVLKGPARQEQMDELIACARNVRGVRDVENRLSLSSASPSQGNAYPDGIAR